MGTLAGLGGGESLGTAVLNLVTDESDLVRGLDKAERTAQSRMQRIQGAVDKAAKVAGVALLGIGAAAYKGVNAASDLDEAVNKSSQTFGKAAKTMPGFGRSVAKSLGMSRQEALDLGASIGAMLIPMGKSRKEAAQMSGRMLKLAADLGSFHNQDPTDMLDRIRSGLAGETEPLRQFGINISDARVKAFAYKNGIAEVGAELTDGQKIQARYALMIKDAGRANGDFARTSDGLANQQRILKAQVNDLAASLGRALIPAAGTVMGIFAGLVGWMRQHEGVTKAVIAVVAGLAAGILILAGVLKAITIATAAWNAVLAANPLVLVAALIAGLVVAFVVAYKSSETFRDVVGAVFAAVRGGAEWLADLVTKRIPGAFQDVKNWVRSNWPAIVTLVSGPFFPIVALATDAFGVRSALVGAFRSARDTVGGIASAIPGKVKGGITTGWTTAWSALGGFGGWLWGKVKGGIDDVVGKATTGAKAIGRAIINGVKAGVNALAIQPVNRVIAALNAMIDVVDRIIPFVDIGSIPPVKAFAEGGVATGPTLALFGEAGTEVIVPVSPGRRREGRKWLSVAASMLGLPGDIPGPVTPGHFRTAARKWGIPGFADGGAVFGSGGSLDRAYAADPARYDEVILSGLRQANSSSWWEKAADFFAQRLADVIGQIPAPAATGWPLADAVPRSVRSSAEVYVRGLFSNRERFGIAGITSARDWAQAQMGKPYVWGGGHGGWAWDLPGYDCSGFASHVAKRAGASLSAPGTTMTLFPASRAGSGPVMFGFRGMNSNDPRRQHMGAKVLSQWYQFGDPGRAGGSDSQWTHLRVPPGLPAYAAGSERIPADGLALLHRDEAVLDPAEAERWRRGGRGVYIAHAEFRDSVSAEAVLARMARMSRGG